MSIKTAERLEAFAAVIEHQYDRGTVMAGYVQASGLSRLLDRLKTTKPAYLGPHDVKVDDESGYPVRTEPDPDPSKKLLKVDRMQPFAVVSAFRTQKAKRNEKGQQVMDDAGNPVYEKMRPAENWDRSGRLLQYINRLLNKPGAYKLIGTWSEPKPEGQNMPYKEALEKGLVQDPTVEESYLVIKPAKMDFADFKDTMIQIGNWFNQDGILICDGEQVFNVDLKHGDSEFPIGTSLTAPIISRAYSRMRNKPNVPFVFAGTQQVDSWSGVVLFGAAGLKQVARPAAEDHTGTPYHLFVRLPQYRG